MRISCMKVSKISITSMKCNALLMQKKVDICFTTLEISPVS
jgi:hypothetical protein